MEITIKNPSRRRKWGWGYNFYSNSDGSIDPPGVPDHEGTLSRVFLAKNKDATYQAHRTNARHSTAWFFQGKRITDTWRVGLLKAAEDLPVDWDDPQYEQKNSQHHWENDKYGAGWFRGFFGGVFSDLPDPDEIKIRVSG